MKSGEHSTSNIHYSTPRQGTGEVCLFHEDPPPRRKFDLEERLLIFASAVIDLSENLPRTRAGNHVSGQILRSGTSPYPNHGEAEAAESRDDFVHRLKICLKELGETRRWARLIQRKGWTKNDATLLFVLGECDELVRIFHSSIQTAKRNALSRCRNPSASKQYSSRGTG